MGATVSEGRQRAYGVCEVDRRGENRGWGPATQTHFGVDTCVPIPSPGRELVRRGGAVTVTVTVTATLAQPNHRTNGHRCLARARPPARHCRCWPHAVGFLSCVCAQPYPSNLSTHPTTRFALLQVRTLTPRRCWTARCGLWRLRGTRPSSPRPPPAAWTMGWRRTGRCSGRCSGTRRWARSEHGGVESVPLCIVLPLPYVPSRSVPPRLPPCGCWRCACLLQCFLTPSCSLHSSHARLGPCPGTAATTLLPMRHPVGLPFK